MSFFYITEILFVTLCFNNRKNNLANHLRDISNLYQFRKVMRFWHAA